MKQREVQDQDNIRWTCVQALAGVDSETTELAQAKIEANGEPVKVVCTPSGGARSVRIELSPGWEDALSDEALLNAICAAAH